MSFRHPTLSTKQSNHWSVRFISNLGKVCGLLCGCILGMFPLLFYDSPERLPPPKSHDCDENETLNALLEMNENDFTKHGHEPNSNLETVARTLNSSLFTEYKQFIDDWNKITTSEDNHIGQSEVDD